MKVVFFKNWKVINPAAIYNYGKKYGLIYLTTKPLTLCHS